MEKQNDEENLTLPKSAVINLRRVLADLQDNLAALEKFLPRDNFVPAESENGNGSGRAIEGVFDGMQMVGANGEIYAVPANYASKSKLVEGDLLKLTVTPAGAFVFKQIGPIERSRLTGELINREGAENQFDVLAEGKIYHVITASVTFFKGKAGDQAVILTPKNSPSRWAAIENILKST